MSVILGTYALSRDSCLRSLTELRQSLVTTVAIFAGRLTNLPLLQQSDLNITSPPAAAPMGARTVSELESGFSNATGVFG